MANLGASVPALLSSQSSMTAAFKNGDDASAAGNWSDALEAYTTVLKFDPEHGPALRGRCQALQKLGRQEEALACIWQNLAIEQPTAGLWLDAGTVLFNLKRYAEARTVLRNALRLNSALPRAWGMLGETLAKRSLDETAEICFRRNAALAEDDPLVRLRLAQWLTRAARYDEAISFFAEVLRLVPGALDAASGLAQVYISMGRLDAAEPLLRGVLQRDSTHLDAAMGMARLLLLKGEFRSGWPAYEVRRRRDDFKVPKLPGPEWDGSPICGKTLIVYPEQGFGDVLQFLRYVPILAGEGARVILLVPKELEALCQCLRPFAEIASTLRGLPVSDFHCPLLSVAWHLGTDKANIPGKVPYLHVEPSKKQRLPVPLGTRLKVGVVWAGRPTHANDRHRSISLESLMPLAAVPGICLYSLQIGPHARDIHKHAHPVLIGDLSPHLKDFVDTARVIEQLDVVVAVDTSVAHLAGALGKPVWVLIPYAPDWRWLLRGETTPWYPTMRLFRQSTALRWDDVIENIASEIGTLAARAEAVGTTEDCVALSVFPDDAGLPRYKMTAPHRFLTDAGIRYLFNKERGGIGYEYATRCFLDAHLAPGDLFIDVGAHWGIMSLHAASRWPDVHVLACEPTPRNLPFLRQWILQNGHSQRIEVIAAAIADGVGRGSMRSQSTMGHSLEKAPGGAIPVTTIDQILSDRPNLHGRRVIVKIDVEGSEADVIAGMRQLLASGRVAAVIWERGRTYDHHHGAGGVNDVRAEFDRLGYSAWCFESEDQAGPLEPFIDDGRILNVFELSRSIEPRQLYRSERLNKEQQPDDPFAEIAAKALAQFHNGLKLQEAGQMDKALAAYAQSGILDRRSPDLFNNLGVALQRMGRLPAAEAAYRQSIALDPDNPSCLSNLGSVLREQGKLAGSIATHSSAVSHAPTNASILANAGHAYRDQGQLPQAQGFYERSLALKPENAAVRLDFAKSLLQQGDFENGFRAYTANRVRTRGSRPASAAWDGTMILGQTILIQDDGTIEDAVQFSRFIPDVAACGASHVVLQCRPSLIPLFSSLECAASMVPIDQDAPDCDLHCAIADLPALLQVDRESLLRKQPYLHSTGQHPIAALSQSDGLKIGLVWATTPFRQEQSCALGPLLTIFDDPKHVGFSLQQGPNTAELLAIGGDDIVQDLAPHLSDYGAAARILRALDLVITVDGAVAHLAGALGVPGFVLLNYSADWRWLSRRSDSPWYQSLRLFRQPKPSDWESVLKDVKAALSDWDVSESMDQEESTAPRSRLPTRAIEPSRQQLVQASVTASAVR